MRQIVGTVIINKKKQVYKQNRQEEVLGNTKRETPKGQQIHQYLLQVCV